MAGSREEASVCCWAAAGLLLDQRRLLLDRSRLAGLTRASCWTGAGLLLDWRWLVAGPARACCWTRAGLLLDPRRCGSDAELDGLGYRRTQAGWMWARDSCD